MKRPKGIVIAIDGPAGSGKSTVAKLLAKRLGYLYVDTGAMYRCVAFKALRLGMDINDEVMMSHLAQMTDIALQPQNDGSVRVLLDGEDVTEAIRTPEISEASSVVSAHRGVREALTEKQKLMADQGGVVMEGRDVQTVVVPDAEVKIFLTATLEERAKRRWLELKQREIEANYEQVLQELKERDERDSTRSIAPLRKAPDAIEIDTTNMTIDEVVDKIVELALTVKKSLAEC
ncbi:MAG: (d)CMP kinase [Armatimonadetes bacterium]|nr:(d)CMP kinase [Armatimonadota bacterium]MDW8029479.1 (d)CMP kinase [Armatimonadota bacterium]